MKKTELIKLLKKAKNFEPDDLVLSRIRSRVDASQNSYPIFRYFWQTSVAFAAVFVVVVLQNPMNAVNLNLAYAKASLTTSQDVLKQEAVLDTTHSKLAMLNLVGEPGKYTKDQCEAAYKKFYDYMADYEMKLVAAKESDPTKSQEITRIESKIAQYETEAEKKWPNR